MKVCPVSRISSLAPEICSNVFLTADVFYMEKVFLYLHGPTEHTYSNRIFLLNYDDGRHIRQR